LVRGLYLLIYRDSIQRGLTHWYAVMAKGLYAILKRWGIPFTQIGPPREYHGLRTPFFTSIKTVEHSLERVNPQLLHDARVGLFN
jgi:N-acyl amino acid synthase of PEP-CTERM/exosortase system